MMSKFINNRASLCYDDVLIVPSHSTIESRSHCDTSVNITTLTAHHHFKIPIMAANMDTICGPKMASKMDDLGGIGIIHRNCPIEQITSPSFVAVGSLRNDKERIDKVIEAGHNICVDIAHGHSVNMQITLEYIRNRIASNKIIIAGNVCTQRGCNDLSKWGANIVKVGVGGGSACTTRIKTGCGVPQFQAVLDCADTGIPIIADGGIRHAGDAAKALAAGAKFVMIGGMLAGTDYTPDWNIEIASLGGYISYRGMASMDAKASTGLRLEHEEGVSVKVKARPQGSTEAVIKDLVDGIKSAMSYSGECTLDEFAESAKFCIVTSQTQKENQAHIHVK